MKIKGRYSRYLTVVLFLSILPMGTAMGFFDAMKVNLFSEMKGVVTLEGKPVKGAVITRTAIGNNDKEYTDSTTTDSEGRFYFEKMETHMFLKLIPIINLGIYQKVIINYDSQQYLGWDAFARGHDKSELNEWDIIGTDKEIDIDLKCELTAKETDKSGAASVISGICNWEGQKILD